MNEEAMKKTFIGKTISNIYREENYWVIEFEGFGETCVRFMSEIENGAS